MQSALPEPPSEAFSDTRILVRKEARNYAKGSYKCRNWNILYACEHYLQSSSAVYRTPARSTLSFRVKAEAKITRSYFSARSISRRALNIAGFRYNLAFFEVSLAVNPNSEELRKELLLLC
jgi:hypothetical protein